ncbi:MAG: DinB family protein [Saprospiraceae bacterium]|nr:DinB family protein [Saprospiraceae bacterium]MCF8252368.1 DinB family protein [Saprospiraceae bacterium]MCF8282209.1 DinB family protein [Bacteroidales bacterium]MCF8311840.1 DinB family protein [Saprospiraceae bacterium]MCF8442684.1 DinB family protein [Saprospiraceae bacterium]
MKKSDLNWPSSYFDTYINKVADVEISEALAQSLANLHHLDVAKLRSLGNQVYAPGKWTVRDIIQHLSDCERVFAYRALRFARNDKTALPGFDENLYAVHTGANTRPLEQVLEELKLVRKSTIALFDTFDDEALRRTGVMANSELPVLALGFTIVGHQTHHFGILEERYLPLLNA